MQRTIRRHVATALLTALAAAGGYALATEFQTRAFLIALLLGAAAGLIVAWRSWRRIGAPERALRLAIAKLGEGAVDQPIPPKRWGDLQGVANAVEEMRARFHRRVSQAEAGEAQLRAVLADMVEGVLVLDLEGRVQMANHRLKELLGAWGELVGQPHWEAFREGVLIDALAEALTSEDMFATELRVGDGGERHLQMHATPFARGGETVGTVAVFHDVSELRRLEGVRRDFVANVSHELKTPLTAIRGFAETLRSEEVPASQREHYLGVIERHAERLSRLIEDLLALSRIEGRREVPEFEELDLSRVVAAVVSDVRPQLEARKLQVEEHYRGAGRVWSERRALEQIATNLMDNAIKYTDAGGRIEVRVEETPTQVRLSIADTGIGIAPSLQGRIFERFYRVDEARGRDVAGTGLGLSIVKHLVQLCAGEIYVESEPGEGTTFVVAIPRIPPKQHPSDPASS